MEGKLKKYIENLFHSAPETDRTKEIMEDMIVNNTEKYRDLVSDGMDEKQAYDSVISGLGNMDELFAELESDRPRKKPRKKLPVIAKVFIIAGICVAVFLAAVLPFAFSDV